MKTYEPDIEALIGGGPSRAVVPFGSGEMAGLGGAFEGASRFDRQLALWSPALRMADLDILPEKGTFDARVQDLGRNDAYVQGGHQLHRDNIVGSLFMLQCQPILRALESPLCDETWSQEFQEEVETKFTLWAESPDNWPDATRSGTLTDLTRLVVGVYAGGGEAIATAEWLRDQPRLFNTAVQMVEGERISTPPEFENDPNVRGGIRRDYYGAPIGYYIRDAHPSDFMNPDTWTFSYVKVRKPWGRLQVIHVMERTRINQSRGVADMVAALKEMKITKQFRDIVLQNAVVNATYAASIESELPSEAAFAAIGGGQGGLGQGITDYAQAYLGAIAAYTKGAANLQMDGVKIPHLFPGTKLQLRPAGSPGGVGQDFEASLLRYTAAALGVSYEQLSRDYSQINYSSLRGAVNETKKFMGSRKRVAADKFATAVFRLWFEEARNKGEITTLTKRMPDFYDRLNRDAYTNCTWIGAGIGQIDELKETQAAVLRLKYNMTTYAEEMARFGKDWRQTFAQRQRENKEMELRDLQNDESNAINAASGSPGDTGDAPDSADKKPAKKAA